MSSRSISHSIICQRCFISCLQTGNLQKYCAACRVLVRKEIDRNYRLRNLDKVRAKDRAVKKRRRVAHPEIDKEQQQRWREKNREYSKQKSQAWRDANVERSRASARQYVDTHQAERKAYRIRKREMLSASTDAWRRKNLARDAAKVRRRYAKKRGASGTHTLEEFLALCERSQWACVYCGFALTSQTVTEDHVIPIARGGDDNITNIAPACLSCNSAKGTKLLEEFLLYRALTSKKE